MDNELLEAKGLLLGHSNDLVKEFIKERFFEKVEFSNSLKNIVIDKNNSTWIYQNISDILLELFQKTGIDLYFDDVDIYNGNLSFTAKYVNDDDEINIEITWR